MHYVYKLPDDYDFSYWLTPTEDLIQVKELSKRKAFEWSLTASLEEKKEMRVVSDMLPSHYFISLCFAVSESIEVIIDYLNTDYTGLLGIYLQRCPELISSSRNLFFIGLSFRNEKYAVSAIEISKKEMESIGAVLVFSPSQEKIAEESVN
jgi:hypothetical protein